MDTAITDCSYNYGYSGKVMFPVTIFSNVTNESNSLSQHQSHS